MDSNNNTWDSKSEFKKEVRSFAQKLEINIEWLAVRPMKNKWASCSTNGHLHFNKELLSMGKKISRYVILHELLHFFVPNHGKLWKSLMSAHLGDYQAIQKRLKKEFAAKLGKAE
jgi:hypothetical protein